MNNGKDDNKQQEDSQKADIEIEADEVELSDPDDTEQERPTVDITEDSDPQNREEAYAARKALLTRAHQLAIGMGFEDRHQFPLWILLLALPSLVLLLANIQSAGMRVFWFLLHQVVMMFFFYTVANRWVRHFKGQAYNADESGEHKQFQFFALFTLGLWLPQFLPGVMRHLVADESYIVIFSAVYFAGLLFYFQFFFYFIPILMGASRSNVVFQESYQIVRQYKMLPLLAIIIPFLLVLVPDSIVTAFSPDHRYLLAPCLISLIESCYWILHVYLCTAYGLMFCPQPLWHRYEMDPYRNARFAPVLSLAFTPLVNLLKRNNLLKLFFLGLLISMANMVQLTTSKPSPSFNVLGIDIQENDVTITLEASDPEFQYRGFQPRWLTLAGPKGNSDILDRSSPLADIQVNGRPLRLGVFEELRGKPARISVRFHTTRTGTELQKLEDLYLWYSSYKLLHLDMSTSVLSQNTNTEEDKTTSSTTNEESSKSPQHEAEER